MHSIGRPGIWLGALIGLILTAPLTAIFYCAYRLAGLPFVPFHIFDWQTRVLPGAVVTAGIDAMVRTIHALGLPGTSNTAKLAEQTMAVAIFIVAGVIAAAIFFALMRLADRDFSLPAGLIAGGLLGAAAACITNSVSPSAAHHAVVRGAWIVVAFLAWGAFLGWAYRRTCRPVAEREGVAVAPTRVDASDRRRFVVQLGGAAAVITVVGATVGKVLQHHEQEGVASRLQPGGPWSASHPLPNADAAVKPVPGTRPEFTPLQDHYRIDINTTPPAVDEASWRLQISGLVDRPLSLTLADLRARPAMHQFITLACISNTVGGDLIGTTRWTGVSLKQMLPDLGLRPNATHLKMHSADGFYEVVALDTIKGDDRVMLTYAWDGLPLAQDHGFPLRIYIPDRYGMKQPKWIESIEATDHWEPGYWVVRGWDRNAIMKATSVIDTVATNMMIGPDHAGLHVPIGGIAHAGVRGISKVEIQVDDGPWTPAQLRTPLSGQTWVLWRYDWPFQAGKHTFTVRCYDGSGAAQIVQEAPPHPSGATGLNSRSVML
jgi:DMSO/TMAO reductase YedYZ molybdopterin-dependent catalytic subunit